MAPPPWRAGHEEKLMAPVLQPAGNQYNGQGVVQASTCLPLHMEGFDLQWRALWDQHVNFGLTRSHKKLSKQGAKRKRADGTGPEWQKRLAAKQNAADEPVSVATPGPAKVERKKPSAQPPTARRNFAHTKAAQLLVGAGLA